MAYPVFIFGYADWHVYDGGHRWNVMKNRGPIKRRPGASSPAAQSEAERCRLFLRPLLEKREKGRTPSCFALCQKNKPALYFAVKVAHPPSSFIGGSRPRELLNEHSGSAGRRHFRLPPLR